MSDVKIVVSADGANSEAVLKAVTDAVNTLGAQIKSVAETSKKEKDAFDVLTKTWGKNWHDLSETANNSLELIKKGISGAKSAFDYLREGADISEAQQNFRAYAASIGKDADDLMKKMRQASKNQVSDMELMQSATKALRLGVAKDAGTIGKLLEIADAKGDLFGKGLKETFDTMVDAIGKGQSRTLIELGMLPESFGRASNAADLLKNRVVLLKEVLKSGQTDIAALAPVGDTASDSFNQLEAALKNLNDSFKSDLSQSLVSLVDFAKTTGIPAMKSVLDLFNDAIKALSKINETTGVVNGGLSIMAGALAGMAAGKVIGGLISVYDALIKVETAQLAVNAAMLKNPVVMGGMVVGAAAGAAGYDAKLLYDEWQANKQAAAMDKELEEQNNPASIARAEIMKLEAELKTYGDISQLTARRADLLQKINSHKQAIKDPLAAGIMSGYGLAGQTNDLGKAEDELKKIEAETAKIEAVNKRLADTKDTLKVILEQRKAILDAKRPKGTTPATSESDLLGLLGGTTGGEDNKKLTKELEERKKLFEALPPYIEESQKELAKFLDEMERLADKDTQVKSVVDALTNLSGLDFSSTLNQFGSDLDNLIAGTNQTLIAMNFMSGGLLGAQGSKPVTREGAAAQMMSLMSGGLLGYSGANNLEQKLKESFAKVKDEAKELENPLADTIASAVSDGFRRADFSGFLSSLGNGLSGVVGGILTDTIQSAISGKNTGALAGTDKILGGLFKPVFGKNNKLNIGALGQNLAVGAAFSFLTSPGRLFGGRVVHGQENINASSSLNDQVTQAKDLRDRLYIQAGITDATRRLLDEAEFYYSWVRKTKSGNGITSKKTTTYLLEGAAQAQSSIDKIKFLQETALGEQANRNYSIFQAGRYSNTDALAMTAADAESAYQASLATNENSPEIQAMRGQQDYYRTLISNIQTSAAQQARQTKGNYNYYQSNMLIGNYQQQIAALQAKIDASSGYKYSAAERAEMLQQRDQAQINLTTAKESGRTNLMQTFMGNNTMLQQASSGDITDMLFGNRQLGNNADMISTLVPMIESAKFKDYEMTRAFADAGSDPEKLLAAYQAQQAVDTDALAVARRLYEDAKEESLNTNLSPEEYTAAFERFQTSLDKVTELQAKVADNTSVIADLQKQSALDKLTTELSDIMSVVVEKINQKPGVEIHTYRQAYTKAEFVAKLKETLAAKDPELAAEFAKYSQYIEELGDWE